MTMENQFSIALDLLRQGNIQSSIQEAEKMSFDSFLAFVFYCREKTQLLKELSFWTSLLNTRYSLQFFEQPHSHLYLSDFFKQSCKPKFESLLYYLVENQSSCLIKSIRVSKAFLKDDWYSLFQEQFQNQTDHYLTTHFQCFTLLKRIDVDLWKVVEKESSCLKLFENSPLELLNELALWYSPYSDAFMQGHKKIMVEVINVALDYLLKNNILDIDESTTENEIIEAKNKSIQKVNNFCNKNKISPVFEWLNSIRAWHINANNRLQLYCFDLNYEPEISHEGIISLKPISVERIKEWEINGFKISLMFNHYSEIEKKESTLGNVNRAIQDHYSNGFSHYVDNVHLSAEKAWITTYGDEHVIINGNKLSFKKISRFFHDYSKSCLLGQRESLYLSHDSYESLKTTFDNSISKIDSAILLNFFICNGDRKYFKKKFDRHNIKTNIYSTPFLKFGDHIFLFNFILANTRPYTFLFDNLLNQNKDNVFVQDLSAKFEDRISQQFHDAGFITNLGNEKKIRNGNTGEEGDLDSLAYKDGVLFVIEAKQTALKVTLEDVYNEYSSAFLKGASQLNKSLKFIELDFENIKNRLNIQEASFNDLKICPLIISTSFESDHERMSWGDKSFLKISWHELLMILSKENYPRKILENIENNEFWKFLDIMPTSSITEKSIPIAYLSEPQHPNSEEICKIANAFYENGKYKEAIAFINQAIDKDESNSDYYILLGDIYAEINNIESAKNAYETAIKKDTYNSKAYNSFGCFWQENEKWELSYENFKKAIDLNPLDDCIINSIESAWGHLVKNGIWTNQRMIAEMDELRNRKNQINEIEHLRLIS